MQPTDIIAAIRARLTALATAEAAMTPGPWGSEVSGGVAEIFAVEAEFVIAGFEYGDPMTADPSTAADFPSIAALRNEAPGLLVGIAAGWLAHGIWQGWVVARTLRRLNDGTLRIKTRSGEDWEVQVEQCHLEKRDE